MAAREPMDSNGDISRGIGNVIVAVLMTPVAGIITFIASMVIVGYLTDDILAYLIVVPVVTLTVCIVVFWNLLGMGGGRQ